MLTKLDIKTELKHLYNPSGKTFSIVEVPSMNFLMIDGIGDPNTAAAYKEALEALYAVAYTLKFSFKKTQQVDYPVMPLEGLWWMPNMDDFSMERRDEWQWTMMMMQPEIISADAVTACVSDVQAKKTLPALPQIRFERFTEGAAAQILYKGPYRDEGPTIARLHEFIHHNGYQLSGKHHEIYLGDPRRSAPENLKTVIRQPMGR